MRIRVVVSLMVSLMIVFVSACASRPKDPSHGEFRRTLANENIFLHKKLELERDFQFLSFTLDQYYTRMSKQNPDLVREIKRFDEIKFGTAPRSFVICVRSKRDQLVICDNSSTPSIDRVKYKQPVPDLNKLMDEIRGP